MSSEVRFGNVSSIDYDAGKCEVTYPDRDDTVTEMVPFLSSTSSNRMNGRLPTSPQHPAAWRHPAP